MQQAGKMYVHLGRKNSPEILKNSQFYVMKYCEGKNTELHVIPVLVSKVLNINFLYVKAVLRVQ